MSTRITLTTVPITQSGTNGSIVKQQMFAAVDVARFDVLDLECVVTSLSGGIQPVTIGIATGWDLSSENIWYQAATFPSVSSTPTSNVLVLRGGFQRYIRWTFSSSGSVGSCQFHVSGTGETYFK